MDWQPLDSSFRDPSGFVFTRDGVLYRQVNRVVPARSSTPFIGVGAVRRAGRTGLLVPHRTVPLDLAATGDAVRGARSPSRSRSSPIPTSGRSASSATRRCSRSSSRSARCRAASTLRDASAYNVQFRRRPAGVHRHALVRAAEGGRALGGVPAVLRALPGAARAHEPARRRCGLAAPHPPRRRARSSSAAGCCRRRPGSARASCSTSSSTPWRSAATPTGRVEPTCGRRGVSAETRPARWPASLRGADRGAELEPRRHRVGRLRRATTATPTRRPRSKRDLVAGDAARARARARSGTSAPTPASTAGPRARPPSTVVAFDIDPAAVERNYRRVRAEGETGDPAAAARPRQPLARAGMGPHASASRSSSAGPPTRCWRWRWSTTWPSAATCRSSGSPRSSRGLAGPLVIEFVPKDDSQVQRLLRNRGPTSFRATRREGFEAAFRRHFRIDSVTPGRGAPAGGVSDDLLPRLGDRGRVKRGAAALSVPASPSLRVLQIAPPTPASPRSAISCRRPRRCAGGAAVVYALAALVRTGTVGRRLPALVGSGRRLWVLGYVSWLRSRGRPGPARLHLVLFPFWRSPPPWDSGWWLARRPAAARPVGDVPDAGRRTCSPVRVHSRHGWSPERARAAGEHGGPAPRAADRGRPACPRPARDIYLIVLDEYANADVPAARVRVRQPRVPGQPPAARFRRAGGPQQLRAHVAVDPLAAQRRQLADMTRDLRAACADPRCPTTSSRTTEPPHSSGRRATGSSSSPRSGGPPPGPTCMPTWRPMSGTGFDLVRELGRSEFRRDPGSRRCSTCSIGRAEWHARMPITDPRSRRSPGCPGAGAHLRLRARAEPAQAVHLRPRLPAARASCGRPLLGRCRAYVRQIECLDRMVLALVTGLIRDSGCRR